MLKLVLPLWKHIFLFKGSLLRSDGVFIALGAPRVPVLINLPMDHNGNHGKTVANLPWIKNNNDVKILLYLRYVDDTFV